MLGNDIREVELVLRAMWCPSSTWRHYLRSWKQYSHSYPSTMLRRWNCTTPACRCRKATLPYTALHLVTVHNPPCCYPCYSQNQHLQLKQDILSQHNIETKEPSKVSSSLYRYMGMLKNLYCFNTSSWPVNSSKLSKEQQTGWHFWTGLSAL